METLDHARDRRRFLKRTAAAGGSGILLLLAADREGSAPPAPATAERADDGQPHGYRLTEHIRAYYDSTRS